MNSSEEIQALRSQILSAREAYYSKGTSPLSDDEYDALEEKLRILSPQDPLLKEVGSTPVAGNWPKAAHHIPMGSLNKAKGSDGIKAWWDKVESMCRT
jgi:DNA ligase (NAD+)